MPENRYTILSVQRALRILKLFNLNRTALTLSEISRLSGVNKSTNLRMLSTLVEEDFIKYNKEDKKYRLGIELFRLGHVISETMDLRRLAKPLIEEAANKTGLIVHIGILEGTDVVIIEKLFPNRYRDTISMVSRIGGIVPVHCTGVGKTILAFRDYDDVRKLLDGYEFTKYSDNTITDIEHFIEELEIIRKRGYGINDGEHEPYIKCYTFPVFNYENKVVAAISLTGLKEELDNNLSEDVISIQRDITLKISRELGYQC